jgi:hypothetical protein
MLTAFWTFRTAHGVWSISQSEDKDWHATFDGQSLGNYQSPILALDELVSGLCLFPSDVIDPARCGLPDDLSNWDRVVDRMN